QSYYAPNLQKFDPPVYVRGINSPCGVAGSEWINVLTLNTWLCGTDGQWHANTGGSGGYQPFAGAGVVKATGEGDTTTPAQASDINSILGFTPVNPDSLSAVATSGLYSALLGLPTIPTNTSQLINNSGFITSGQAPVQSVNGSTGAVSLTIPSLSGNTTTAVSTTGTLTNGHCFAIDANGNAVDSGGACSGSPAAPAVSYTPPNGNVITQQTQNLAVIPFCVAYG